MIDTSHEILKKLANLKLFYVPTPHSQFLQDNVRMEPQPLSCVQLVSQISYELYYRVLPQFINRKVAKYSSA